MRECGEGRIRDAVTITDATDAVAPSSTTESDVNPMDMVSVKLIIRHYHIQERFHIRLVHFMSSLVLFRMHLGSFPFLK
ncbi:MAG: hypothetical protein ACE5QF_04025 [Thermoplasmata archaeon]